MIVLFGNVVVFGSDASSVPSHSQGVGTLPLAPLLELGGDDDDDGDKVVGDVAVEKYCRPIPNVDECQSK